jgi:PAS domain S-box-containing protein
MPEGFRTGRLKPWQAYGVAIVATAATVGVRLVLHAVLEERPTLVIFTLPIMLSAYLGGWRAGLLATALSCLAASYFLLPPLNSLRVASEADRWQQFFVALAGVFISVLNEALHRARRRDLASQRTAEKTTTLLSAIVSSSSEAIIGKTLDGTVTSWNAAAERIFGYSAAEMVGQSIFILVPEELHQSERVLLERVVKGEPVELPEAERLRKDGRRIYVAVSVSPIRDASGHVVGSASIKRDITYRRQAAEALSRSQERLSLALKAAHMGTMQWHMATDTLTWDEGLRQLYGIEAEQQVTRYGQFIDRVHRDDRAYVAAAIQQAVEGRGGLECEFRIVLPDGRVRWLAGLGQIVRDETDKDMYMTGVCLDITERRDAEEQIGASLREVRQLAMRLMQAQDEERRRIARQLHETTAQDLAALKMNLGALERHDSRASDRARSLLLESTALAERSMNDIRTLSYLLHPPFLDEAGLASALRWYVEGFSNRSGLKVELRLPNDFQRLGQEIETALFRMVQESLSNIHRHAHSPAAEIRLKRLPDTLVLEIQDWGCGMPPYLMVGGTGHAEALGVGIAGMRERINQLGGHFEIESTEEGTIVRALLPSALATSV